MQDRASSEHMVGERSPATPGPRLSRLARIVALTSLLTMAVWVFPRPDGILCSLSPEANVITVTGVVRTAPRGTPLPRATVYSDRELVVTGEDGVFRLTSGRGAQLQVEAAGYRPTHIAVKDATPLLFLLFPEQPPGTEQ